MMVKIDEVLSDDGTVLPALNYLKTILDLSECMILWNSRGEIFRLIFSSGVYFCCRCATQPLRQLKSYIRMFSSGLVLR